MRNYVAVVFNDKGKAYEGLHALWEFDDYGTGHHRTRRCGGPS